MAADPPTPDALPALPAVLLRHLLPHVEREEVLEAMAAEFEARAARDGRGAARRWVWRQVLASVPALVGRGWWRGWSGFATRSDRMQPGGFMLESWGRDVRFALRRLRKRPTYTALVVVTLALGVAGTSAVFGITRKLLMDPLPVVAEEEVAVFWFGGSWSEAEFSYVRPEMTGFRSVTAYRHADVTLQEGDGPARLVRGYSASAELFDVLGARPVMGPGFREGDDRVGTEPVAVLSHALWRELGSDPEIVGSGLQLGGQTRTVVGVMPRGFWFPEPAVQVWLAEEVDPENGAGNYTLMGRVERGESVGGMDRHLANLVALLDEQYDYPEQWDKTVDPELTPLREHLVGSLRPAVLATLAAMAVILLIACVNVAALMLGQVDARGTELAVRGALGAGRARLLRQLVAESLVVGAMAGLVGAVLGVVGFRVLVASLPLGALAETATLDWGLFVTAMVVALVAATVVSLAPGISVARSDLQTHLTRGRTGGVGGRGGRLESALVVAQVALVLLMVSGAALLIRSVGNFRAIDPGVDVDGIAVIDIVVPSSSPSADRPRLIRDLVAAVEGVAGVESAGVTQRLPLRGSSNNWGIEVEGRPDLTQTTTAFRPISPGYLETMGVGLVSGRMLEEVDRAQGAVEGAVVINRALAERYFPGVDPVGRRIRFMTRWDRIVGVVENVAESGLDPEPVPARYMTYEQVPWLLPAETIVIRSTGRDAGAILEPARRAIQEAAPGTAIRELTTMRAIFDRAIGPALQVMTLLSLLGGLALTLGIIGVYGVVSHFVTRRRRDWGVRLALGMRPPSVLRRIVARGGLMVAAGVAVGTIAFLFLARVLASFLYGIQPVDPLSLAAAAALLLAVGLGAAFVPARRAARIDPARVLREQ